MAGSRWRRMAFVLVVAGAYGLVLAPVLAVIVISIFAQEIVSFPPEGFTLRWYANAWEKREFARGFVTSLQVAFAASAIGVPLGTAAALAINRGFGRMDGLRGAMNTLLLGPLAVPGVHGGRPCREPDPVQRGEQPVAGPVPGEDPAGPVRAVGGGRQTDDDQAGRRIAEAGHGLRPVRVVAVGRPLLPAHLLAPLDQARARPARHDVAPHGVQAVHDRTVPEGPGPPPVPIA